MQTSMMDEARLYDPHWEFGGPWGPSIPFMGRQVLSWTCVMLGELSQVSLLLVLLRDLPHTYFCTCFYSTKQRWKQARTLPVVNTGESKLLLNLKKNLNFFYFIFIFTFYFFCFLFYFIVLCFFMAN